MTSQTQHLQLGILLPFPGKDLGLRRTVWRSLLVCVFLLIVIVSVSTVVLNWNSARHGNKLPWLPVIGKFYRSTYFVFWVRTLHQSCEALDGVRNNNRFGACRGEDDKIDKRIYLFRKLKIIICWAVGPLKSCWWSG